MARQSVPDPSFVNLVLSKNLVEKFEQLRGAPGICVEPASWEDTKALVAGNTYTDLATLGRHPSGIVKYRRFRKQAAPRPSSSMPSVRGGGNFLELALNFHGSWAVFSECKDFLGTAEPWLCRYYKNMTQLMRMLQ